MQVVKIFQGEDSDDADFINPWNRADFEGWLSILSWKVVLSTFYLDIFFEASIAFCSPYLFFYPLNCDDFSFRFFIVVGCGE